MIVTKEQLHGLALNCVNDGQRIIINHLLSHFDMLGKTYGYDAKLSVGECIDTLEQYKAEIKLPKEIKSL